MSRHMQKQNYAWVVECDADYGWYPLNAEAYRTREAARKYARFYADSYENLKFRAVKYVRAGK